MTEAEQADAGGARIVCGVSALTPPQDLAALLALGVDEVFVGYLPPGWLARFGAEVSPNRRYEVPRQIGDLEALRRVARACRDAGARLSVTLNDHTYAPAARARLADVVDAAAEVGASSLIVADPALAAELAATLSGRLSLIASTEAGVYNVETARWWADLGVERIIFPRELRLSEMAAITAALAGRGVAFEAFVAREFCVNSSAYCFASHGYGLRAHLCHAHTSARLVAIDTGAARDLSAVPPGWSAAADFLAAASDLHRCGLCAVEPLLAMGVRYLKVPGRSSSALAALRRLRTFLDGPSLSRPAARRVVGSDAFCRSGEFCYYDLDEAPPEGPAPVAAPALALLPAPRQAPRGPALAVLLEPSRLGSATLARLAGEGLAAFVASADVSRPWEREVAAAGLAALEAVGVRCDGPPQGVVISLESCALRLPRPAALAGAVERVAAAGFTVAVAAPLAYQAAWPALVSALQAAADPMVALVANDPGLLAWAARHWPGPVSVGRLYNRMRRHQLADAAVARPTGPEDADAATLDAIAAAQRDAYGYPHLRDAFHRDHLQRHGVVGVAFDALPTPLSAPLPEGLAASLWGPWTYLASTRACPVAAAVEGAPLSHPTARCQRPCEHHLIERDYPWPARLIVQRGAATYMDCSGDLAAFWRSASRPFDGVVLSPLLPH